MILNRMLETSDSLSVYKALTAQLKPISYNIDRENKTLSQNQNEDDNLCSQELTLLVKISEENSRLSG